MLFNSIAFAVFFPIVTLVYFLLAHRFRWAWLLAASCLFYAAFIPAFLAILALSIGIDYVAGIVIEDASPRWRRPALIVSLVANITLLAVFKYAAFIWLNVADAAFLFDVSLPMLPKIILPIGLSFHTFQAMAYTIEVYRGNQKAERHPGIYALYVMFYPQLVAGPIERPQNLLHQFREPHVVDEARVRDGLSRMLWGLVKKIVIADRLAIAADAVFQSPNGYGEFAPIVGVVCFSLQIYCDFSGYSDIALGAAKVMGFDLMENFRQPYFSRSIPEFWSRWHISLSTWFRDYLYIPLGGNRVSPRRWCLNIMIVFAVSGLWHGANWTFVVWGVYHGLLTLAAVPFKRIAERFPDPLRMLGTFALVSIGWVFFRAHSLGAAATILSRCVTETWNGALSVATGDFHPLGLPVPVWELAVVIVGLLGFEAVHVYRGKGVRMSLLDKPMLVRWASYECGLCLIFIFGKFGARQFIYFQF
ncbi:MAG: MBOAT family protein [Planctomycetota bacterium]|nr:MBOAT family protein [Planctomycetota bacterium]